MVERARSNRGKDGKRKGFRGGKRPGAGRRFGSANEAKSVARAVAARTGDLPHELLLQWARTGKMSYPSGRVVELEASERIQCAKGCAAYYKPSFQPRPAPGEQPPVVRVELDPASLRAMATKSPDKLDVLREVLKAVQAGGGELGQVAAQLGAPQDADADPARYGRMLDAASRTAGSA